MDESRTSVSDVRAFWNANPCGIQFVGAPFGTRAFYEEHERFRYSTEWHLDHLVDWDAWRDKDVLEIGCGLGGDGARFAKAGARYTGVDLTPAAVEVTRLRLETLGLPGKVLVQNAEELPDLRDASFDLVYSHGVLHHTPGIERALTQVHRVLRPGGRILFMLYHRNSFNYYVRILAWLRARVLLYSLGRAMGRPAGEMEPHRIRLREQGLRSLATDRFVHHCTDGPDCPLARVYTRGEAHTLLSPWFEDLEFEVAHFPITKWAGAFPRSVEGALARTMGWYLFIYGKRRDQPPTAGS